MAITYKTVLIELISTANELIYECPANTTAVITSCIISNRSSSSTYTLDDMTFDATTASPATGTQFFHGYSVGTSTTKVLPECEGQLIEAEKQWRVSASATELCIRATIKEIT